MKLKLLYYFAIVVFLSISCEDNDNKIVDGPEVEWVSGGTSTTYTYSGGVLSGYYFHRSFKVLNESGEVTIEVQVENKNDTKVSETFNVEQGMQYSLKVNGSKIGSTVSSPGGECLNVVFSSPSSRTTEEISVGSYSVSTGIGDTYYCPDSFNFGDINLVE